jgi:hypothetical protein
MGPRSFKALEIEMTYDEARNARRALRATQVAEPIGPLYTGAPVGPSVEELMAAGREFARRCSQRADSFAANSSEAAFDIAAKLERFGSYASQKQADYAAKLVGWAKPRESAPAAPVAAPAPVAPSTLPVPQLASLIAPDRFAGLQVGGLTFRLRNDPADLVWVKDGGDLVGVIDRTTAEFKPVRAGLRNREGYLTAVAAIEVDPRRALEDHGTRTGRCGCCGRLLTDPTSVSIGIGPVCREKSGWF